MKYPPIVIALGDQTYKVRTLPQDKVSFYELMRQETLNRALHQVTLLDDSQIAAQWTIFSDSQMSAHRMIISLLFEHLTSVSGDENHSPMVPGNMIGEMIQSLEDE